MLESSLCSILASLTTASASNCTSFVLPRRRRCPSGYYAPGIVRLTLPIVSLAHYQRVSLKVDLPGIIPSCFQKIHILISETPVSESETGWPNYPAQRGFESNLVYEDDTLKRFAFQAKKNGAADCSRRRPCPECIIYEGHERNGYCQQILSED